MSLRVHIYLLLAMSMLFMLVGAVAALVVAFGGADSSLFVVTTPFFLVSLLGMYVTSVVSKLSDRVERLERSQAGPAGAGGSNRP